jgi:hypothetical protein
MYEEREEGQPFWGAFAGRFDSALHDSSAIWRLDTACVTNERSLIGAIRSAGQRCGDLSPTSAGDGEQRRLTPVQYESVLTSDDQAGAEDHSC